MTRSDCIWVKGNGGKETYEREREIIVEWDLVWGWWEICNGGLWKANDMGILVANRHRDKKSGPKWERVNLTWKQNN